MGLKQHETDIKKPCDATRRLHCDYCAKQFKTVKYRKIHERIHTGENSHTCKYCKKVFSQRSNLTVHVKKNITHIRLRSFLWRNAKNWMKNQQTLMKNQKLVRNHQKRNLPKNLMKNQMLMKNRMLLKNRKLMENRQKRKKSVDFVF